MHKVYDEKTFTEELVYCSDCGWEGKGNTTVQEHLFLTDATEIFCPHCSHYLGFISHDVDDQQYLNNQIGCR